MTDRRLTPANARVALEDYAGPAGRARRVRGRPARIVAPLADLLDAPEGRLDRQLLLGAAVTVIEEDSGRNHAFVQAAWDGYVGYVAQTALGPPRTPTHLVAALSSHVYPAPDIKTRPRMALPMAAALSVTGTTGRFATLEDGGFVPLSHLQPIDRPVTDWVAQAERFLNVPYLWGGNGPWGIDCSGLVQVALRLAGIRFPADSDLQEENPRLATVADGPRRGDLVFWPGHVAIFRDGNTLLHANAHHMAVTLEPRDRVVARIRETEGHAPRRIARIRPAGAAGNSG